MAISAKTKSKKQDYPILKPFRQNGQWHYPKEKTIPLSLKQASFLLLSGKVGKPGTEAPVETKVSTKKETK
ncbi:hypothetical protein QWY97_06475 [Vibrio cortegadensis]|uniref:hypothetical protein n=1 Tax=Vibrio cortegadensis TaxID=1328770 RepID=UPI0021C488D1|nr:hypothetical protein [Vibrio cortegadensis]MDN3696998.1 hypothetical protein [Vibrio cortegadensis]